MKNPATNKISSVADLAAIASDLLAAGEAACLVRVEAVSGSTPRDAGTMMLITEASFWGTIGGGQLEWMTLEKARAVLESDRSTEMMGVPLGPEINQCCGGKVELSFHKLTAAVVKSMQMDEAAPLPQVQVHGAGHTGRALCEALSLLPFDVTLVDVREDSLSAIPSSISTHLSAMPEAFVRDATPGTAFVTLTHSHDLDFLIVAEALAREDAAYVGMIGSNTKRAVFEKWLGKNGYDRALAANLVCPIGGNRVKDKRPEVIAALVAAELLAVFAEN